MVTKTEAFEGGAPGATLTTGNSSFTAFGGGPPKFNSTVVRAGQSVQILGVSNGTAKWTGLSQAKVYFRGWFKLNTMTANRVTLASVYATGAVLRAVISVQPELVVKLQTAAGVQVALGIKTLELGKLYRIEWDVDTAGTTQTCRIYDDTGTLLETLAGACPPDTITEFWFGSIQGSAGDYFADDLEMSDAALAPIAPPFTAVWHLVGPALALTPLDLRVVT